MEAAASQSIDSGEDLYQHLVQQHQLAGQVVLATWFSDNLKCFPICFWLVWSFIKITDNLTQWDISVNTSGSYCLLIIWPEWMSSFWWFLGFSIKLKFYHQPNHDKISKVPTEDWLWEPWWWRHCDWGKLCKIFINWKLLIQLDFLWILCPIFHSHFIFWI